MNRRRFLRLSAATAAVSLLSRRSQAQGEIWRMSASDIARGVRTKTLSAREAVQAHLDRIEAVNRKANAVTRVLSDDALRAADEADRVIGRGVEVGPLHGVPMSVKENVDVTGSATTQGVKALKEAVPSLDHPAIAQLRKAGAIPIARTNLPDFGLRWHTESDLHGATTLEQAGYAVEEVDPPAVEEAAMLWRSLVGADVRTALWPPIQEMVSPGAREFMEEFLSRVPEVDLEGYVQGFAARNGIARRWSAFFERHPLVLGPVSTEPPFRVGLDLEGPDASFGIFLSMRLVVTVNLLGLPAAAVPVGVANGLPQRVQIIGPMYREDLCLDAAEAIENALGTITPIDPR